MRDELPPRSPSRSSREPRGWAVALPTRPSELARCGPSRLGRRVLIPQTVLLELLGEPGVDMTPEFVGGVIEPPAQPAR